MCVEPFGNLLAIHLACIYTLTILLKGGSRAGACGCGQVTGVGRGFREKPKGERKNLKPSAQNYSLCA